MNHLPSAMDMSIVHGGRNGSGSSAGGAKRSFLETEAAESLLVVQASTCSSTKSSSSSASASSTASSPWSFSRTPTHGTTTMTTTAAAAAGRGGGGPAATVLQVENRSIPHKKRRQMPPRDVGEGEKVPRQQQHQHQHHHHPPYRPSPLDVQPQGPPRRLLTNDTIPGGFSNGGAQSLRPAAAAAAHEISSVVNASTPTASAGGIAAGSATASAYSASSATKVRKPTSNSNSGSSGSSGNGSGGGSNSADAAWMHRLYPFDGPTIEEFTPLFNGVDIDRLVDQKLTVLKDKFLAQVVKSYYGASNSRLPLCFDSRDVVCLH
jgi:hypothetical protein